MSASPVARQASRSQSIPQRKVVISDESQLPVDYSTTPGGTLYSTTPGGTRLVYERSFLLHLRNSPLARTPPKNLPNIPGILLNSNIAKENGCVPPNPLKEKEHKDESQEQFQLDM